MARKLTIVAVMLAMGATMVPQTGWTQDRIARVPAPPVVNNSKKISYQLASWRTRHIHDENVLEQTIRDLKKIGCQVVKNQHGDHFDVRYRCPEWKTLELENDQQVEQWRIWLNKRGMETVVLNPPKNRELTTVRYRLPNWRSAHLHDLERAQTIIDMFGLIGCEVTQHDHNGHIDARFRCPQWTTIGLNNRQSAMVWEKWLRSNGFEVENVRTNR